MTKRSRTERRARERQVAKKAIDPAPPRPAFARAQSAWVMRASAWAVRARSAWAVHRRELSFLLAFLGCSGVLSLAYAFPYEQGGALHTAFASYLAGYARAAGALLALFDASVHVEGASILGRFSMQIVKDCDAMEVNILFASAVLAFPVPWWRRALGVLVGVSLLAVANLTRIACLYWIGVSAPSAFEAAHRDVFPLLLIGVTVLMFVAWARWAGWPGPKTAEPVHAAAR